ncbi:hypothetical protein PanWU01x14_312800 [Parasponia andersonii]|uniref:Uncharacterized protein n=1 Tax=Parasponia andersonii TaxID=3476 RepID=A0A2P5APF9_PARAD|nr:hypothetical protein PanWU01x14_312800 [Parasponia andersonii]
MQYKARSSTTKFPEKMASTTPIAIGTRGTVGSLVRKEIEYFTKLELDRHGSSRKARGPQILDMASSTSSTRGRSSNNNNNSWPSLRFLMITTWRRKKHRGSSRSFMPSICSASEVEERNRLDGIPGFSYRILRDDIRNFEL